MFEKKAPKKAVEEVKVVEKLVVKETFSPEMKKGIIAEIELLRANAVYDWDLKLKEYLNKL